MICKISIILLVVISICSLIDGKRSFHDNDLELTDDKAQMFLRTILNDDSNNDEDLYGKRESGKNCVPCKFKINPCCEPNKCRKKLPWNECMEFKTK
jgi:hypothetical protein